MNKRPRLKQTHKKPYLHISDCLLFKAKMSLIRSSSSASPPNKDQGSLARASISTGALCAPCACTQASSMVFFSLSPGFLALCGCAFRAFPPTWHPPPSIQTRCAPVALGTSRQAWRPVCFAAQCSYLPEAHEPPRLVKVRPSSLPAVRAFVSAASWRQPANKHVSLSWLAGFTSASSWLAVKSNCWPKTFARWRMKE